MLAAVVALKDVRSPPGNRLEGLRGDRIGQRSIRINDQFRICFVWAEAGPTEVEVVDHHQGDVCDTDRDPPRREVLREEYLVPGGMSATALTPELHVPPNRITAILNGTRSVSAGTAMRLGRYFEATPGF